MKIHNMPQYLQEHDRKKGTYNEPKNKKIKYAAISFGAIATILLLIQIILINSLSIKAILIMRGCAGLSAIIFVTLAAVLSYRVNKAHISSRHKF